MGGCDWGIHFSILCNKCIIHLKKVLPLNALSLWAGLLLPQGRAFICPWYLKPLTNYRTLFCVACYSSKVNLNFFPCCTDPTDKTFSALETGHPVDGAAAMNPPSGLFLMHCHFVTGTRKLLAWIFGFRILILFFPQAYKFNIYWYTKENPWRVIFKFHTPSLQCYIRDSRYRSRRFSCWHNWCKVWLWLCNFCEHGFWVIQWCTLS